MSITLSQLGADTPRRYTVDDIMALRPCPGWDRDRMTAAFGSRTRVTATEIAGAADVSPGDRLWVLISLMDESTQCLFACDCAERVVSHTGDPRSAAAITAARRFVFGLATMEDLAAAWDDARAAAWGAWDATKTWADARAAETLWQVERAAAWMEQGDRLLAYVRAAGSRPCEGTTSRSAASPGLTGRVNLCDVENSMTDVQETP